MSSIVVAGDTSGSVTLSAPAVAGSTTLTLPSVSGTVTTNTTLAGADANIHGLTVGLGGGSVASNTVVGSGALGGSNTGGNNIAVGYLALNANTSGAANVSVGSGALISNTTGSNNTAINYNCLTANTTGSANTAIGFQALTANTTASNNTAVGYQAGNTTTTGGSNIFIGNGAVAGAVGDNNSIVIGVGAGGKGTNTTQIATYSGGYGSVYQGNNSTLWAITSDQRLKQNIVDNTTGLNVINAIQVRNFEYRTAEEVTELEAHSAIDIKGIQLGAIAQELQLILPECVKTESTGVMSVDATNLTWYLINAVKELSAELDALKLKVGAV